MTHLIGIALALLILAAWVVAALVITRHPFRAVRILVAGMAFHNFGLMVLLALGTPSPLIRVVQAWKEGLILVLLVIVARLAVAIGLHTGSMTMEDAVHRFNQHAFLAGPAARSEAVDIGLREPGVGDRARGGLIVQLEGCLGVDAPDVRQRGADDCDFPGARHQRRFHSTRLPDENIFCPSLIDSWFVPMATYA